MKSLKTLLVLLLLLCGVIGYYSYKTSEEVKALKVQLQVTENKVDSLMMATAKIAQAQSKKTVASKKQQPKSFWEELFSALEEGGNQSTTSKATAKPKITVTSSYRLEDRYVSYRVHLPEYVGNQEGIVVVNISVDRSGDVKRTSIGEGSTITDEEVLEASRKAALQTNFNYDSSAENPMAGTITYTFKKL